MRGGRQQFLYSRLMCWVALDRGIRLAGKRSFPAPLARWITVRDRIYRDIYDHFWDAKQKAFVRSKGSRLLDAACLLMPLVKFASPRDPRWLSTLNRIGEVLVEDSLVHRYAPDQEPPDGLAGKEGSFSMLTFWYAECLARSGDVKQARFIFEKMLGYANEESEEHKMRTGFEFRQASRSVAASRENAALWHRNTDGVLTRRRYTGGFTLIELLVVIAIIALLASMLYRR